MASPAAAAPASAWSSFASWMGGAGLLVEVGSACCLELQKDKKILPVSVPLNMPPPPTQRLSSIATTPATTSARMSDGSDGSGSDIDPDEMPGEFSSTAENIEPDELPAEWFADSAPNSAPSTPAGAAAAAAAPPITSTSEAGSSTRSSTRSLSPARSYYDGSTPRPPPTPPLVESPSRFSNSSSESPSRLSNRSEGAPRAGGSPEGNLRRRAGQSPWAKKPEERKPERDEKEEEEEDRAVRQDSLKAQMDWLVALEDADPDLEPISSAAPAEIEISVVVPDGASAGRRLQGQIEVGGKRRTVDVVLPEGVECGDVLQVLIPVGAEAHSNGGQAPTTGVERARFNVAMGLPESDVCHAGLEP